MFRGYGKFRYLHLEALTTGGHGSWEGFKK